MKKVYLINASTDATSSINSVPGEIGDYTDYAIHVDFTGTNVVGSLKLQASNDAADWIDIPDSTQAITSSSSHMWNVRDAGYQWVRIVWTYTSGTGNIQAILSLKAMPSTGR